MTIAVAHFADGLGNLPFNEVVNRVVERDKKHFSRKVGKYQWCHFPFEAIAIL